MSNPGYGYGGMLAIDCGSAERANQLLGVLQHEVNFGLITFSLRYADKVHLLSFTACAGSAGTSDAQ